MHIQFKIQTVAPCINKSLCVLYEDTCRKVTKAKNMCGSKTEAMQKIKRS